MEVQKAGPIVKVTGIGDGETVILRGIEPRQWWSRAVLIGCANAYALQLKLRRRPTIALVISSKEFEAEKAL